MKRSQAKRERLHRRALLSSALALVAFLAAVPEISSTSSDHPYYATMDKFGLMFENASFAADVGDPVWARPSLPRLLERSQGQEIEPIVKLRLGRLYQEIGRPQQALAMYEQAIQAGGAAQIFGLFELQQLFYDAGDYGRTVSSLDYVKQFNRPEELAQANYLAGQALLRLEEPSKAVAVLEQVPPGSERGPFARYSLAMAHARQGKTASAQKAFEESIDAGLRALAPRRVTITTGGERESRLIDPPLFPAERLALEGLVAKARLGLGYLMMENKKFAEAERAFSEIPEENPFYAEALYAKAWAQIYQGQSDRGQLVKAIVTLNTLIRAFPTGRMTQEAWLAIGSTYVNLGVHEKAISAYQDAIKYYNDERELAAMVAEQGFVREHFDSLRMYFDPGAVTDKLTPTEGMNDEQRRIFARLVTNPDVRAWFSRYAEMGEHLRELRRSGEALRRQSALLAQKLDGLRGFESRIEQTIGKRVDELEERWRLLDDRINLRGDSIDIWQLATRKETELLKSYNRRLAELAKIGNRLQRTVKANEGTFSAEEAEQVRQTRERIQNIRRRIEIERGELAWKILSSTELTATGVRRVGLDAGSGMQRAILNKELSKLRGQIDRAREQLRAIREETVRTRTRYRELRQGSLDLAGRHSALLRESERRYLALGDKVIAAVTGIYRGRQNRLERFVAEAEFGVIGALDRQASQ